MCHLLKLTSFVGTNLRKLQIGGNLLRKIVENNNISMIKKNVSFDYFYLLSVTIYKFQVELQFLSQFFKGFRSVFMFNMSFLNGLTQPLENNGIDCSFFLNNFHNLIKKCLHYLWANLKCI